jgi:hypothetical protein
MSEQILETPYFPTDKTDKSPNSDLLSVLSVPYLSVFKMHGRCNHEKALRSPRQFQQVS